MRKDHLTKKRTRTRASWKPNDGYRKMTSAVRSSGKLSAGQSFELGTLESQLAENFLAGVVGKCEANWKDRHCMGSKL